MRNSGKRITNNNYNIAIYRLTEELRDGDVVTLIIKGQLGAGKTAFAAYNSGDIVELSQLLDKGNGIYQNTFVWRTRNQYGVSDNKTLWIWTYPSSIYVDSTIEWIKLEKGNKATDWTPAPEDIENKVADIQTDLQNAINNAKALIEAETQNRQQTDTNVSKLVNKTNFLSDTYTVGNAMATGTMILGNSLGVQAGVTGVGYANNDVRLWAGSNYVDRNKAPFRVLQDGTLYAKNANISGNVDMKSGKIGNIGVDSNGIGSFFTDIENGSSFRLTHEGLKFFSVYSERIGDRVYTQTIKELEISANGITIKFIRDGNITKQKTYDLT